MSKEKDKKENGKEDIDLIFSEKVEFIDPPNHLKEKAGKGGISKEFIEKAEGFIRNNDIDFVPFANEHLKIIDTAFGKLKTSKNKDKQKHFLNTIIENIMHIKAHGGMFNYTVMSKISGATLTFLDGAETINDDLFQIIDAHNNTLKLIIKHDIKGDGGAHGAALLDELTSALLRYQKKYSA